MRNVGGRTGRWSIILAGGDGLRLRPLTQLITGDERPKQFCPLLGGLTLLEQTQRRVQRSIPSDQILISLTRTHEQFYRRPLADCPSLRVVQPQNRGTAAAILSSMLLIARQDQNATVAVFPSDHYYSDESVVEASVEKAFDLSHRETDSVILLGAHPHGPEVEYGWIELGESAAGRADAFRVRGFHEKPIRPVAHLLIEQGALWNTFIMVGKVYAFLEMMCAALPGLLTAFRHFPCACTSKHELRIEEALYDGLPSADFSRQVLSTETERLIVQQLGPVTWSDLGDCERTVAALSPLGLEPKWATAWRAAKPHHAVSQVERASASA